MQKMKKGMAVVLTATMVAGSALTAFAAETGTGNTTGTGTSEGHVNKEVVNMVLPTIADGSTPFAYTMDPERLIQETEGAKYEDFTFPAKDGDTGVYFLTDEKTYANTSNTLQAVNKSSCNVKLTVDVETTASAGGKDITLASSATPSTTTAELYLGLKVGNETKVVSSSKETVTKIVAGTPDNFEVAVKDGSYAYQEKADATTWKAMNISMSGAVSEKTIAADTTAPTVKVTWSFEKAGESDTTVATDAVDYTTAPATSSVPATVAIPASGDITVPVTIGSDNADLTKLETSAYAGDMLTMGNGYGAIYASGTITLGNDIVTYLRGASADELESVVFTATFGTGEDAYNQTFTFSK